MLNGEGAKVPGAGRTIDRAVREHAVPADFESGGDTFAAACRRVCERVNRIVVGAIHDAMFKDGKLRRE